MKIIGTNLLTFEKPKVYFAGGAIFECYGMHVVTALDDSINFFTISHPILDEGGRPYMGFSYKSQKNGDSLVYLGHHGDNLSKEQLRQMADALIFLKNNYPELKNCCTLNQFCSGIYIAVNDFKMKLDSQIKGYKMYVYLNKEGSIFLNNLNVNENMNSIEDAKKNISDLIKLQNSFGVPIKFEVLDKCNNNEIKELVEFFNRGANTAFHDSFMVDEESQSYNDGVYTYTKKWNVIKQNREEFLSIYPNAQDCLKTTINVFSAKI